MGQIDGPPCILNAATTRLIKGSLTFKLPSQLTGSEGNTGDRVPVCGNMEERVGNSLPGRMGALTGNIGERAKCWGMVGNSIWERESVGLRSFTFKLPFIARGERKGTRENAFGLWELMGAHGELAPSGNKSHIGEHRGTRSLCGDMGEHVKERGNVGAWALGA